MPVSPTETRASLICRLKNADDVAAWDEFVQIYAPVVHRAATARGLQTADADNLVQEVLFAVSQSVAKWLERTDRGSFRLWLLALARNHTVDILTSRSTTAIGRNDSEAGRILDQVETHDEISALIDAEYERAVFRWAADRVQSMVAEHTWQAFWLTHVEGVSVPDAAMRLKTRPGNIYFARCRVMARIQELVKQYEGEHGG